jgi:O-Antigen ligase
MIPRPSWTRNSARDMQSFRQHGWKRTSGIRGSPFALLPVCFALGGVISFQPRAIILMAGAAAIWFLVTRTYGRFIIFLGGALLTLQSSDSLTIGKLTYLVLTVICAAVATYNCLRDSKERSVRRSLLGVALVGILLLFEALRPLWTAQASTVDVARDAITYLLLFAAVPIGIDTGRRVSARTITIVVVIVGLLSSVGFGLDWLDRRGVSLLSQGRFVFASMQVVAFALSLAAVKALGGPRIKMRWLMLLIVLPAGVLVTGTRTGLIMAVAIIGVAGGRSKMRVPIHRIVIGLTVVIVLLAVALPILTNSVAQEGFFARRVGDAILTVQQGVGQDRSGQIRELSTENALAAWHEHIFFGQGLGYRFKDPNPDSVGTAFALDTPATYLAKFGLIGTGILALALLVMMSYARSGGWTTARSAARGVSFLWVAYLPFGPFTEDKGFALSIALLFALLASADREIPREAALGQRCGQDTLQPGSPGWSQSNTAVATGVIESEVAH